MTCTKRETLLWIIITSSLFTFKNSASLRWRTHERASLHLPFFHDNLLALLYGLHIEGYEVVMALWQTLVECA